MKEYITIKNPYYLVMREDEHTEKLQDQKKRSYFLRTIPIVDTFSTVYLNNSYTIRDIHCSVYEHYSEETDFFSPLHISVTLQTFENEKIKIRFYLDEHLQLILIGQDGGNDFKLDKKAKKMLETHIQYQTPVAQIVTDLSLKLQKKQDEILGIFKNKKNNKELLPWLIEQNPYFYGGYFNEMIGVLRSQLELENSNKEKIILEEKTPKIKIETEAQDTKKLMLIDNLLSTLRQEKNWSAYKIKKMLSLLEQKFNLLGKDEHEKLFDVLKEIGALREQVFYQLEQECKNSDLQNIENLSAVITKLDWKLTKRETYYYQRAVRAAFEQGNDAIIQYIAKNSKINLNEITYFGDVPLFSFMNNKPMLTWLFDNTDINPDCPAVDGGTLLSYAVHYCDITLVDFLLEKGCNPNIQEIPKKHFSVEGVDIQEDQKRMKMLQEGLKKGTEAPGATPLFLAIKRKYYDIAKKLLEKGANPRITTNRGYSPIGILILDFFMDIITCNPSVQIPSFKMPKNIDAFFKLSPNMHWEAFTGLVSTIKKHKIAVQEHLLSVAEKIFLEVHSKPETVKEFFSSSNASLGNSRNAMFSPKKLPSNVPYEKDEEKKELKELKNFKK